MASNNPFYIEPASPMTGMKALHQGITNRGEYLRKRTEEKKKMQLREEAVGLVKRGDPNALASFVIKNPWIREDVDKVMEFKNDITKQNAIDSARRILLNKEEPIKVLTERAETVLQQGGDASGTIELLKKSRQDPELAKKEAETILAVYDPDAYKQYKAATEVDTPDTIKTAEAWYINKNPNATPEQVSAFVRSLDKEAEDRKTKTWILPNGQPYTLPNNVKPPTGSVPYTKGISTADTADKKKQGRLDDLRSSYEKISSAKTNATRGESEIYKALSTDARLVLTDDLQRRLDIIASQYADAGGDVKDLGIDPDYEEPETDDQIIKMLPSYKDYKGKIFRDKKSGKRFKATKKGWERL